MILNLFRRPANQAEPSFRDFLVARHGSVTDTLLDQPRREPARSAARPFVPTPKKPGELVMHSRGFGRVVA